MKRLKVNLTAAPRKGMGFLKVKVEKQTVEEAVRAQ